MKGILAMLLLASPLTALEKSDVLELYKDDSYLQKRISIYQYMQDTQPVWDWTWQQCPIAQAETVLDVGCGFGSFWQSQAGRLPAGCNLTLTDISAGMVELCKKNTHSLLQPHTAEYQVVDAEQLPYADALFDRVHCCFVLYYTHNPVQALQEIKRVLRSGGLALIFVLHSEANKRLYEIAHEVDPRFPAKDIIAERCCEKNIEDMLASVFTAYQKHVYHRYLCIPSGVDMSAFVQSIAQGYKVPLDQAMLDAYQQCFNAYAQQELGISFTSQSLLYVCRK